MNRLLVLLLGLSLSLTAVARDADLELKLKTKLVTKLFNQALGHFVDERGYIKESIPTQKYDLEIDMSEYVDQINDYGQYGQQLLGINLKGKNKLQFLFQKPYIQAKVKLKTPKFTQLDSSGDQLKLDVAVEIENLYVYFKHIWFNESGFTSAKLVGDDSCTNQIRNGSFHDRELVREHQAELNAFYRKLNGTRFSKIKSNIWARIDDLSIGHREYTRKSQVNNANVLKLSVSAKVDLRDDKPTVQLLSLSHNLGKRGGARLNLHLSPQSLIIPPIFVRSKTAMVDSEGYMMKNEDGSQVWGIRCTAIDTKFASEYASAMTDEMAKQVYNQLTDDMVKGVIKQANEAIAEMDLKNLPRKLVIGKNTTTNKREYLYPIPREMEVDMYDDIANILGDFYDYRAALGLNSLKVTNGGYGLVTKIDADLRIDRDKLVYRESKSGTQFPGHSTFKFGNYNDHIAVALSGKMIQKTINLVKNRVLRAKLPEQVSVKLNDDTYNVDSNGYIHFKVRAKSNISVFNTKYKAVDVDLNVKVKPYISKDRYGKVALKVNYQVPNGKEILNAIRLGKAVKTAGVGSAILISPLGTLGAYVFKEKIKNFLASKIDSTIQSMLKQNESFDLTEVVEDYGVEPTAVKFSQSGHAAVYIKVNQLKPLDEAIEKVKETISIF
jgi:hypothetical protein